LRLDNPGSCIPRLSLSLAEDNDFCYEHQVAVNTDHSDQDAADVGKIGHIKVGPIEIFVKEFLSNIAWQVTDRRRFTASKCDLLWNVMARLMLISFALGVISDS